MKHQIEIYLLASAFSLLVGWYTYRKKSVSKSGLLALLIISQTTIWLDEIPLLFILFFMFASSSALSALSKKALKETDNVVSKSGPRDYIQALANLGVGTVCILGYKFTSNPIWIISLIGSVATGNADSWASEIGSFSKHLPLSIINFKPLAKGVSGGITLIGTLGGLAGSVFISILSLLTLEVFGFENITYLPFLFATCIAGFLGMLFDSFTGAYFQALYFDKYASAVTEIAQGNELVKGYRWMNNDMVNFLSTFFGGAISVMIYLAVNKIQVSI